MIEKGQYKQEEFDKYLKQIRIANKSEEQEKHWLMLIYFLTEEMMLLSL